MRNFALPVAALLFALFSVCNNAWAGGQDFENEEFTCLVLIGGKQVLKQNCYGSGFIGSNIYSALEVIDFYDIAGYGDISVKSTQSSKTDKNGSPIVNKQGLYIYKTTSATINGKNAILRLRLVRNLKPTTDYDKKVYTCYQQKNSKFEFCYR